MDWYLLLNWKGFKLHKMLLHNVKWSRTTADWYCHYGFSVKDFSSDFSCYILVFKHFFWGILYKNQNISYRKIIIRSQYWLLLLRVSYFCIGCMSVSTVSSLKLETLLDMIAKICLYCLFNYSANFNVYVFIF